MDPTYPKRYPKDSIGVLHPGYRAGVAISDDNRLEEYFEYLPSVNFDPNRGKYHFSHYRLKRYDNSMLISEGQLIEMRAYEMYLYQAEYYLKSEHKSISLAKRILNDPSLPRISKNPDWSARLSSVTDPKKILDIIYYERDIELMGQGFLLGFCDMRRREMLQRGTIIHFPIPGKELEVLGMKYYTFGGPQRIGVNNEGTSSGGWLKDEDYNY
jgi:hypothetical protein